MGKRKERRIAAMAASRRVKLDIFVEPPGDSGGSPAQDELGDDIDPRHRDESPNSPSSSGKQPENPLLLLGQYSDDEVEEQSGQQVATSEKASIVECEQVNGLVVTENEDKSGEEVVNSDAPNDNENDLAERMTEQVDATEADSHKEEVFVEETPLAETFDVPSDVDVNTIWKLVLHEESGQYYYWNTVTGETSWVVPDVLASGTDLTGGQETDVDAEKNSSSNPALYAELNGSSMVNIGHHSIDPDRTDDFEEKNEPGSLMQEPIDDKKDDNLEDDEEALDAYQANKDKSNLMSRADSDLDYDLSSSVLRHGESLLERFKSMKGSRSHVEENDWISRYMLEVEIRLSDAKSLVSFGSSLLPFWVHSERKLKDLEAAFDAEVCQFFIDETQEVEVTHVSHENERIETGTNKNDSGDVLSDIEKSPVSGYVDISKSFQKDQQNKVAQDSVLHVEHVTSIEYSKLHSESSFEVNNGRSETAEVTEVNPETTLQYEEGEIEDVDMDMDVDMEVEDAIEPKFHPNPSLESTPLLPQEDFDVPPPPGEDWIPPPPPDSEPVPPPPPDDSAEPFYPPPPPPDDDQTEPSYAPMPTYPQTIQPLSYTDQYSFTYPSSNFEYYDQSSTEYPINNPYQQAEGGHVAVPNPSFYYGTLPSSYPDTAQVIVNPVESVSYYDLQDGTVTHGPVVSAPASSGLLGEPGRGATGSDKISSLNSGREISHTLLSSAGLGGSAVNGGPGNEPKGTSTAQTQANTNNSVIQSGPMPSATAPAITSAVIKPAVSNVHSKVLRSKKRATIAAAPTLRSNKKVSSLVDKWKAAKEELHEDEEDEPETAYDILEKKRQREIEKWKKQQIASGEAKDNANFQPLGGDWRERVKRKRTQLKKEDKKSPSEDTVDVKKQPDLGELSRDLSSGWQVYWDETSKQVYYGNTITSETTWTRPGG